jgi:hypothetical protein
MDSRTISVLTIADLILEAGSCSPANKASLIGFLISSDGHGPTNCGKTPDQYFLMYWLMRTAADCRMERSICWFRAILHKPRPPSAEKVSIIARVRDVVPVLTLRCQQTIQILFRPGTRRHVRRKRGLQCRVELLFHNTASEGCREGAARERSTGNDEEHGQNVIKGKSMNQLRGEILLPHRPPISRRAEIQSGHPTSYDA